MIVQLFLSSIYKTPLIKEWILSPPESLTNEQAETYYRYEAEYDATIFGFQNTDFEYDNDYFPNDGRD